MTTRTTPGQEADVVMSHAYHAALHDKIDAARILADALPDLNGWGGGFALTDGHFGYGNTSDLLSDLASTIAGSLPPADPAVRTFELAIEHANSASYSRSVDPTAKRRMHAIMTARRWATATLVGTRYGAYEAGPDKCVSIFVYQVPA